MPRNFYGDWFRLFEESTCLWFDSLAVISMRSADILAGRATAQENALMVSEKIEAVADLSMRMAAMRDKGPTKAACETVTYYRRKVAANRRRLARGGTRR